MIHSLAREHLKRNCTQSGIPSNASNSLIRPLHLNMNFFSDSEYVMYPSDDNPEIASKFIKFLITDEEKKNADYISLSHLTSDHVLFYGTSMAIDLLINTFCEPLLDRVCICNPTFPLYAFCAKNHNVPIIDVPMTGENYDCLAVQEIVSSKPKITFISSPNNPIAIVPSKESLKTLIANVSGIVVIDETYIEFSDTPSAVHLLENNPNVVILRSFSKIWGLAGIRCGAVIAHPSLIATLRKMLPPFFFPTPSQSILEKALSKPEKIDQMRRLVRKEVDNFIQTIRDLKIIKKIYPGEANFISIEFDNAEKVCVELCKHKILVKNCHPLVKETLRISLGTHEDNNRLVSILKNLNNN